MKTIFVIGYVQQQAPMLGYSHITRALTGTGIGKKTHRTMTRFRSSFVLPLVGGTSWTTCRALRPRPHGHPTKAASKPLRQSNWQLNMVGHAYLRLCL